jgi:hypothetical protein
VLRNFHAWVLCGFGALHPNAIALSIGVASRSTLGRFCLSTAATAIASPPLLSFHAQYLRFP